MATSSDWSDAPMDVLSVIGKKLISLEDLVKFSSACQAWEAIFFEIIRSKSLPFLRFQRQQVDSETRTKEFYDMSSMSIMPYEYKEDTNYRCIGSTMGWIGLIHDTASILLLFNPFISEKRVISIPEIFPLPYEDDDLEEEEDEEDITTMGILRVCLSGDPILDPSYWLAATIGTSSEFSLWNPVIEKWTSYLCYCEIVSMVFFMDILYVANWAGSVYRVENYDDPTMCIVAYSPTPTRCHSLYLAVVHDDLVEIQKVVRADEVSFEVYKVNLSSGDRVCTKLHVLKGAAIFIGRNTSISVLSPVSINGLPDTIYFTDNGKDKLTDEASDDGIPNNKCLKLHEIGAYSLLNGRLQMYFPLHLNNSYPAPIWIESVRHKVQCQRLPMQPD